MNGLDQEARHFIAYTLLFILVVIPIMVYVLRGLYATFWLKRYFRKRLKQTEVTPHNVRDQLNKISPTPWQIALLTKRRAGEYSEYEKKVFLKRFSALHFGRSERWEEGHGLEGTA